MADDCVCIYYLWVVGYNLKDCGSLCCLLSLDSSISRIFLSMSFFFWYCVLQWCGYPVIATHGEPVHGCMCYWWAMNLSAWLCGTNEWWYKLFSYKHYCFRVMSTCTWQFKPMVLLHTSFSLDVVTVREHQSGIWRKKCNKTINILPSKGLTGTCLSLFDLISERRCWAAGRVCTSCWC